MVYHHIILREITPKTGNEDGNIEIPLCGRRYGIVDTKKKSRPVVGAYRIQQQRPGAAKDLGAL